MSISQPIIATPTVSRRAVKTVVIGVTSTRPPGTRVTTVDGVITITDQIPEREGQLLAYQAPGETQIVDLYVVVTVNAGLQWVPVLPSVVPIDTRSGKPKDPLYDFYGLHA
jgi:hypothetical protein